VVELDLMGMDNRLFQLPILEQNREGIAAKYGGSLLPEKLSGPGRVAGVQGLLILV
jgi:hypothetical protein